MTKESQLSTPHTRYDVLDGLRGIAALAVMICHVMKPSGLPFFPNAGLAVDFFFILSGFVIAHSYGQRLQNASMSVREYIGRRLIRLYPMFLLGLILGLPILWLMAQTGFSTYSENQIFGSTLMNAAFLPFPSHGGNQNLGVARRTIGEIFPANPPAWSLFFELVASLSFIFLVKLKRQTLIKIVAGCFLATIAVGVAHSIHVRSFIFDPRLGGWGRSSFFSGFPRVLFGFSAGALIYALSHDKKFWGLFKSSSKHLFSRSYLLYALLAAMLSFILPAEIGGPYQTLFLLILAPWLVLMGSKVQCKNERELGIARMLGWLSYPVYCLHFPIARAVFWMGGAEQLSPITCAIISIPVTIILAALLTKFCDEPLRRHLTRKLKAPHNLTSQQSNRGLSVE